MHIYVELYKLTYRDMHIYVVNFINYLDMHIYVVNFIKLTYRDMHIYRDMHSM